MTKGKQTNTPGGPSEKVQLIEGAFRAAEVWEAYDKLVKAGVDRPHLRTALLLIPKTLAKPKTRARGPCIVKGMTDRRLLNFPYRMICFADELEQITLSPLMKDLIRTWSLADFLICVRREPKHFDRIDVAFRNAPDWENDVDFSNEDFLRLPNLLRFYATCCLHPIISNLRKSFYKLSGQKYWTIWLLEFVKACTDQYFYSEVGDLLEVAFEVAGHVVKFEEADLRKLISNNEDLARGVRAAPLFGKGLSPNLVRELRKNKSWPLSYES